MDRITRTRYTNPTQQEVELEVMDLIERLGMFRRDNRDHLSQQIVEALPYRITRLIERRWAEAQA